jgi:ligand-binding sensor domain-containing protein
MKNIFRFLFVVFFVFTSANPLHAQWIQTNGPYGGSILTLAVSGTNVFAGTYGGVFISTDNGSTWTQVNTGLTNTDVNALVFCGTNVFAGTWGGGIFLLSGFNWTAVNTGLTNTLIHALTFSGTNLLAGTYSGVYLSSNTGASWTAVNTGLANTWVTGLAVSGTDLFAGTQGSGVWRRPLSGNLPGKFSLSQNYPNPFNPTTVINYQLAASSFVTLKVCDILGREVATLVNSVQPQGEHRVNFDGSRFASGVYVYRLIAVRPGGESLSATKRMILMK